MKLENCVLVDEVVNYLFRRPNLELPAIFYNWDSQSKVQTSRGLNVGYRSEDNRDIVFLDSTRVKPNFHHGRGEDWKDDEGLCVKMQEKDSLNYWFTSTEKQLITLSLKLFVDADSRVVVSINDKKVEIDLNNLGHQIVYITSEMIEIGKSTVRVELASGEISLITVNIKKEQ